MRIKDLNEATTTSANDFVAVDSNTGTKKYDISKKADKITASTTAATEADIKSGNYFPISCTDGEKKMPAELVAKKSETPVVLEGSVTLADSVRAKLSFSAVAGHTYSLTLYPKTWTMDNISDDSTKVILVWKGNSKPILLEISKGDFNAKENYFFSCSEEEGSGTYTVNLRGDAGQNVHINVTDVSNLTSLIDDVEINSPIGYGNASSEKRAKMFFGDNPSFDTAPTNSMFAITYGSIAGLPSSVDSSQGSLFTLSPRDSDKYGGSLQIFTSKKETKYYIRKYWSNEWNQWKKFADEDDVKSLSDRIDAVSTGNTYPSISYFESIGVIGASFESGVVFKDSKTSMDENYPKSWPQIMARDSGISAYNFSYGGATTKGWLTKTTRGLPKLQSEPEKELYIINLGSNDSVKLGIPYLGTADDIGTDADTFYGNLSKIITSIKAKAPTARIIVDQIRRNETDSDKAFNVAIKNVSNYYSLPCIECYSDPVWTDPAMNLVGGHPLYMGYAAMAKAYRGMIEKCMLDNKSYFNEIPE